MASCRHPDIRVFDEIRCCLACGASIFDSLPAHGTDFGSETWGPEEPPEYQHKSLNFELGQEIRLIVLWPGLPHERIRCEIIHDNLERNPDFEAVSYTWATEDGHAGFTERIYCPGGTIVRVTASCAAALRQIRLTTGRRRVWVDAISIDQGNLKERRHQVGLMDRIYSRASAVLVCINHPGNDYSEAIRYLKGDYDSITTLESECSRQIRQFKARRWFARVWVVQEIALARVALMHVNERRILLTSDVIQRFSSYDLGPMPGPLGCTLQTNGGSDFLTCLLATEKCKSTDQRDKVFAILSLVEPSFRHLVTVDYSISRTLAQVYAHAAVGAILQRQDLELLRYLQTRCSALVDSPMYSSWPSWLPDWRNIGSVFEQQLEGDTFGPWRHSIQFPDSQTTSMGASVEISWPNGKTFMGMPQLQVHAHFVDVMLHHLRRPPWKPDRSEREQIMDALLTFFESRLIMDALLTYKEEWRRWRGRICDENIFKTFLQAFDEKSPDHELFCSRGSVGFHKFRSYSFVEGDGIYAIDGVRSLFILRKTANGAFKIVGSCYLLAAFESEFLEAPSGSPDFWSPGMAHDHRQGWSGMIELC